VNIFLFKLYQYVVFFKLLTKILRYTSTVEQEFFFTYLEKIEARQDLTYRVMNKFSLIQELHYSVWLKVASINISTVPLLHPLSDVTIFICY
jgi:hypothetical protein